VTQLHPVKITGRTIFIREKEYLIRENYIDGTTPIIFFYIVGVQIHWVVGLKFYLL